MKRIVLFVGIILGLMACSGDISGTGQQGEARVAGVITFADGSVAAHQTISVVGKGFIAPQWPDSLYTVDTVLSDEQGRFEMVIPQGDTVTLSAQKDSTLLYVPNIVAEQENVTLETMTFLKGIRAEITPWWVNDSIHNQVFLQGTPWRYLVSDSGVTTILVPVGQVVLVQQGVNELDTIMIQTSSQDTVIRINDSLVQITDSLPN